MTTAVSGSQVSKSWSPLLCSVWSYMALCDWSAKIVHYVFLCQRFRAVQGGAISVLPHVCKVKMLFLHRLLTPCASDIVPFIGQIFREKILKCCKCDHPHMNMDLRICLLNFQKVNYVSSWLRCNSLKWNVKYELGPGTWVSLKWQQTCN